MNWLVSYHEKGVRLVTFLQKRLPKGFSARYIKKAIEKNLCKVNGQVERFASRTLKVGDKVVLQGDWQEHQQEKEIQIQTIYEDEFYLIIDKPPKLVCEERFFKPHILTHRLDKDTSGLLILAKTPDAEQKMTRLFAERKITKSYLAIVDGQVAEKTGVCRSSLSKKISYEGGAIWSPHPRGLEAITEWECLAVGPKASLLLCHPKTGRTHQIRVHLLEWGHPILGDYQYCRKFHCPLYVPRQMLHAYELSFTHPFLETTMEFSAPIPDDFINIQNQCGIQS